jgi:uridine kinase
MLSRRDQLEQLAGRIALLSARAIVGIDGVDGSGKSTFADDLAPIIESHGAPVIRASVDGFHNPRAVRYRRGRADPEGFFLDSYDYESLRRCLLDPFRHGAARVQTARFDHKTDQKAIVEQQVLLRPFCCLTAFSFIVMSCVTSGISASF